MAISASMPRIHVLSQSRASSPNHTLLLVSDSKEKQYSRLGYLHSLANHSATVGDENQRDRVELCAQELDSTQGDFRTDPTSANPESE